MERIIPPQEAFSVGISTVAAGRGCLVSSGTAISTVDNGDTYHVAGVGLASRYFGQELEHRRNIVVDVREEKSLSVDDLFHPANLTTAV
jgi:hypothetical protein